MSGLKRVAVFPGSFDPVTRGHQNVVKRALPLFDKIIIAVGQNSEKVKYFSLEQRLTFLQKAFADFPGVEVCVYNGLTVDFCVAKQAGFVLRGLRSVSDFEFEKNIAHLNHQLNPAIETVFLLTEPVYSGITSTIVREIHRFGGNIEAFVPSELRGLI